MKACNKTLKVRPARGSSFRPIIHLSKAVFKIIQTKPKSKRPVLPSLTEIDPVV